jgi:hypothetical protein
MGGTYGGSAKSLGSSSSMNSTRPAPSGGPGSTGNGMNGTAGGATGSGATTNSNTTGTPTR